MWLLRSKTFWTGLGLVGFGIFQTATGEVEMGVKTMLEGVGLIFLRQGIGQ